MFGKNLQRKPEYNDGNLLYVQSIFKTIQGEGVFVGMPAIFIRLGGCNLACSFCDTEFETFTPLEMEEILSTVFALNQENSTRIKLIVITGGEPLRQNIEPLCQRLIDLGYYVQIETNGTLFIQLPKSVTVICSPKCTNGKYHLPNQMLLPRINAFKFLVSVDLEGYGDIPMWDILDDSEVFVQPMDQYDEQKNRSNLDLALQIAMRRNFRISLQTHKILNIP